MNFKQRLGDEAYQELEKLIKRNIDIRKITSPEEFQTRKKALELLMEWLSAIYDLDAPQRQELDEAEFTMNKMFKIRN